VKLDDFDYPLPPEAIAQRPLDDRAASRLLVLERASGALSHRTFHELPELLRPGDLVVVNRSRVFPARLRGTRPGGGAAEVLLVRDLGGDRWEALVRPGRRLKPGSRVLVQGALEVELGPDPPHPDGRRQVALRAASGTVASALERLGRVPLPPYIRRPDDPADRARYQTIFAREPGSVAAPTAGLHFTPELVDRLAAASIEVADVVLHVGPGTFRPVEAADVRDHTVPAERYLLPEDTARAVARARARGGRVVAVGTTTTRVLEWAARSDGALAPGSGETALVIVPGFAFRAVDALVTNFHLPRSSLLLLVCAFAGRERVLAAYQEAVLKGYRFYSYGDAMLLV
jgi:S-adenosylmethionine:tRNA ribosyltransferase-isomerase